MDPASAVLSSWSLQLEPTIGLLLVALIYARGWWRLYHQAPHRFTLGRLVSFQLGLLVLFIAVCSPLDPFGGLLLQVHMVQHLLLMMVAPPLLLLGYPYLPLLSGLPRAFTRDCVGPFLLWKPLQRLGRFLTHPLVCWLAYVLVTIAWHLPALYELTLESPAWHSIEHACFLGTGILFWWPVVLPWPSRSQFPRWIIIPYLLLADIQNTALSAFLSFYDHVLYPAYERVPRTGDLTALADQNIAGAIMWVPGSIIYLIPAGLIAVRYLSASRFRLHAPGRFPKAPTAASRRPLDLLRLPFLRRFLAARWFRRSCQGLMFLIAMGVVVDGLSGPQTAPMNLAGVLPWTYWRGFSVLLLLVAGNFFCFACPFTFARDLGRRFLPARFAWPRSLRSKWLAIGLLVLYLWAYEAFGLWNSPWLTAWVIIGYFVAAIVVDGFFRNASFCKYVCPIGQFHFFQSLVSPLEVKTRSREVCRQCRTMDCIRGNASQRGCELQLFQPRKRGNMDCTFCLDCVRACPHDNVGIMPGRPGQDLWFDKVRSSAGRFWTRRDLAVLFLVLVYGAFANAASMTAPVANWLTWSQLQLGLLPRPVLLAVFYVAATVLLPVLSLMTLARLSRPLVPTTRSLPEIFGAWAAALVPLGASMWIAHLAFHLFTGSHTAIPVLQRIARSAPLLRFGTPDWSIQSWAISELLDFEFLAIDLGFLLSLLVGWKIARQFNNQQALRLFLPWAIHCGCLYAAGWWILFQPMAMRGTMLP